MTLNDGDPFGDSLQLPEMANQKCSTGATDVSNENAAASAAVASDGLTIPGATKNAASIGFTPVSPNPAAAQPNETSIPISKPLASVPVDITQATNHLVANTIVPTAPGIPGICKTASVPIVPTPTSGTLSSLPSNHPAGSNGIPVTSACVAPPMRHIPTLMQPTAISIATPVMPTSSAVGSMLVKPENKLSVLPKQRAVPILPKSTPILPRVVTLAPRPSAIPSTDVPNLNTAGGSKIGSRDEDDTSDKGKRTSRARVYTEHDDFTLISFWASNYELFCRSSRLSFARKAAEYMNTVFSKSPEFTERGLTHEKQVHNKICYLVRRYESLKQKYLSESVASNVNSDGYCKTVMQLADADFPYFSKMHAFMSSSQPTYVRKRKAPRPSLDPLPNLVTSDSNGDSSRVCTTKQPTSSESATLHNRTGVPQAKARKVESNQTETANNAISRSLHSDESTANAVGGNASICQGINEPQEGGETGELSNSCHIEKGFEKNNHNAGTSTLNRLVVVSGGHGPLTENASKGVVQNSHGGSAPTRPDNDTNDNGTEMMESIMENGANGSHLGACVTIAGNDVSPKNVDVVMDDEMDDSHEGDIDEVFVEPNQVGREAEGGTLDDDEVNIQEDRLVKEARSVPSLLAEREYFNLRKKELVLRSREAKRLEAELVLRQREFECRRMELKSQGELQMVQQLRESAKVFLELGMNRNGYKCMERVALLLNL